MHLGRRRTGLDRLGPARHLGERVLDPGGRQVPGGLRMVGRRRDRLGQGGTPAPGQSRVAPGPRTIRPQCLGQLGLRLVPAGADVPLERVEVVGPADRGPHPVHAEQVDVQIAGRGRDVAEPAELLDRPADVIRRQHVAEQLEDRAGAADRHPEVVQVLGVDVGDHPGDAAVDLGQVAEQGVGHGQITGLVGVHPEPPRRWSPRGRRGERGIAPGLAVGHLEAGGQQPPTYVLGFGCVPAQPLHLDLDARAASPTVRPTHPRSSRPGRRSCDRRSAPRTSSSGSPPRPAPAAPGWRPRRQPGHAPARPAARSPAPASRSHRRPGGWRDRSRAGQPAPRSPAG